MQQTAMRFKAVSHDICLGPDMAGDVVNVVDVVLHAKPDILSSSYSAHHGRQQVSEVWPATLTFVREVQQASRGK